MYLCVLNTDILAAPIEIVRTEVCNGIVYNFFEGINGTFVGRGDLPYEGDIIIPDFIHINGQRHEVLGILPNAFCCSPRLKSIDIRCPVKNVCKFQFYKCYSLKNVKCPESIVAIGECAFCHCHKLLDVKIPSGIKKIEDRAFCFCYQLQNIELSSNLNYLGEGAFNKCYSLKEISLTGPLQEIKKDCFLDCVSLEKVIFGDNIQTIEEKAFFNCQNLNSFNLPFELKHIDDKAFQNCCFIDELILPPDIKYIGWDAFANCDCLKNLLFSGEKAPKVGENAFYYQKNPEHRVINITVPDGKKNLYKRILRWKTHDSICIIKEFTELNSESGN